MSQETELQRLELIVEKLLGKYTDLRAENEKLQQELSEKTQQLAELETNLSTQKSERGEIGRRVSKLVEQIEDWERTLDGGSEAGAAEEVVDAADSTDEASEEDDEPEPAEITSETAAEPELEASDVEEADSADDKKAEEEGRLQHNLFSLSGFQR